MNIQQLEYLLAVDKYKHFGNAAKASFISQPTLSAMIQKLEDELDVLIFDRTAHPIRTTDAGREILKHARNVVDELNELREKALLMNNSVGGRLNLGIIPTVSAYLIPEVIFRFLETRPRIEFEVKEMTTDSIIKAIRSGELDAGIIATPYKDASIFSANHLFNEELMLYYGEFDGKSADSFVLPEDVDVLNVWLLEEGNCLRTQFENICNLKENSLAPNNLNFKASNISTLINMVDNVGGVSILPELSAKQLTPVQQSKIRRFRKPFPYREISIIYYKPTYKQKIIDEFVKFTRSEVLGRLNFKPDSGDFIAIKPE